jgi:hypothetical protein
MTPTEEEARNQDADDTEQLARRATRDVRQLISRETDMFKRELADNLRNLQQPAYELGFAAVLGLSSFGMLLSSFGSERRRGLLLLTSTAFGLASYVVAARAMRAAAQSLSFSRTAEHVERAIGAVISTA